MTNINPRDQDSAPSSDRTDFSSHRNTSFQDALTDRRPKQTGFSNGFLIGFLSSSVLWLLLGGILWFTQLRNTINTAQTPTTDSTSSAIQPTQPTPPEVTQRSEAPNSGISTTNSPNPDTASPQTQVEQASSPTRLNLQQNHPNGTTLRVEQVKLTPDSIAVTMSIINGADFDVTLNAQGRGMYLQDDQGNTYNISPPPTNPSVKVPTKTTARGEFVFLGSLPANSTKLTLVSNLRNGGSVASEYTRLPRFQIGDIPVQR